MTERPWDRLQGLTLALPECVQDPSKLKIW
jgi:hypothetical protein